MSDPTRVAMLHSIFGGMNLMRTMIRSSRSASFGWLLFVALAGVAGARPVYAQAVIDEVGLRVAAFRAVQTADEHPRTVLLVHDNRSRSHVAASRNLASALRVPLSVTTTQRMVGPDTTAVRVEIDSASGNRARVTVVSWGVHRGRDRHTENWFVSTCVELERVNGRWIAREVIPQWSS